MHKSWSGREVLVTGGASFIGSHLVDALVEWGANVRVVDNLSTGLLENIQGHLDAGHIEFIEADLLDPKVARTAVRGREVCFHLAADHGGRGYIATHPVECSTNLILDGTVFRACHQEGVEHVVFASSGCVYPTSRQMDPTEEIYLSEDMVGPPYEADDIYGWAKLMAEMTLKAYHTQYGMKTASCRFFTVYGPRCGESHAVMAMIARAFARQNPFVVWGNGEQVRNWTFVDDIVQGFILAAEKIEDGAAVNLGTDERIRVLDCAEQVIRLAGYDAEIERLLDMPSGVLNRAADTSLAANLLGRIPQVSFEEGLKRTYDWYVATKDPDDVRRLVADEQALLTHRIGKSATQPTGS
ncbi:MAG: NAD-dependent epimerase/dehydratase family protein [Gemmatimonadota bacterium]